MDRPSVGRDFWKGFGCAFAITAGVILLFYGFIEVFLG